MIVHTTQRVPDILRISALIGFKRIYRLETNIESRKESHNFWEFLYLESGSMNVLVDGELYALSPGDLIIYPPHAYHSVLFSAGMTGICVTFETDSDLLHELTGHIIIPVPDAVERLNFMVELSEKLLVRYKNASLVKNITFRGTKAKDGINPAEIQKLANLLEVFLLDLHNAETRSNATPLTNNAFLEFTDYLKENIDKTLTLEEISEAYGETVPHLQKLCREVCGCGPISYFISLKISAAKRMMNETELNFSQIAERLGFSSVHYFSKLFKAKTGMSPSAYLKSTQTR